MCPACLPCLSRRLSVGTALTKDQYDNIAQVSARQPSARW